MTDLELNQAEAIQLLEHKHALLRDENLLLKVQVLKLKKAIKALIK